MRQRDEDEKCPQQHDHGLEYDQKSQTHCEDHDRLHCAHLPSCRIAPAVTETIDPYFLESPCIILPCFIMMSPITFIISPRIWSMCAIIFGSIF